VTGRFNHARLGKRIGVDLIANPDRAAEPEIAVTLACLYWSDKGLSTYADAGDFTAISKAVNLGNAKSRATPNHLAERLASSARILNFIPR